MTRTDASLSVNMNDLRRQRNRQVGSVEASGASAVQPATTVPAGGASAAGAAKKRSSRE